MTTTHAGPGRPGALIFSDLDGTLLHHDSYSAEAAQPLLASLEQQGIPVIFCTSKTYAELIELRRELHNRHPFIVENGAAIYIPSQYFQRPPASAGPFGRCDRAGYLGFAFCAPRQHWMELLAALQPRYSGQLASFSQLGTEGICRATGLDPDAAALASQRQFGEPLQWLGDDAGKARFVQEARQLGAQVLEGGRFMHLSGACDKGRALCWLADCYREAYGHSVTTVAAGDSDNDRAMLEAADHALIVRSPVKEPPLLKRTDRVWISEAFAPEGWVQGIRSILASIAG